MIMPIAAFVPYTAAHSNDEASTLPLFYIANLFQSMSAAYSRANALVYVLPKVNNSSLQKVFAYICGKEIIRSVTRSWMAQCDTCLLCCKGQTNTDEDVMANGSCAIDNLMMRLSTHCVKNR